MGDLGAGHDPCTEYVGEDHSWSPGTNVVDSNGGEECEGGFKNKPYSL